MITASLITAIVALLLIALCLCLMFDVIPLPEDAEETPAAETQTPAADTPAPAPSAEAPKETAPAKVPGVDDLKGCSDDLYHPKPENYLPAYQTMLTKASKGSTVHLTYEPRSWQYSREVILELDSNTEVTALAQENGYTLVLVKEGLAGWLPTYELEAK